MMFGSYCLYQFYIFNKILSVLVQKVFPTRHNIQNLNDF